MDCSCVRPKMAMYLFALLSPLCTYGCVNRWPIRMIQLGKKRPICRHHSPLCPAFSPREHSALPGHHEEDRGSILIQEHQQMHPSSSPPLKLTHFWPMLSASKIHLLHFAWSLCTRMLILSGSLMNKSECLVFCQKDQTSISVFGNHPESVWHLQTMF